MILYADDSEEAGHILQNDLLNIGTWCKFHKLSRNVKKTKAMYFGTKVPEHMVPNIEMAYNSLEFVGSYEYLRIHLESKMSFHYQYKETYRFASYKLLLLKRVRPVIT